MTGARASEAQEGVFALQKGLEHLRVLRLEAKPRKGDAEREAKRR